RAGRPRPGDAPHQHQRARPRRTHQPGRTRHDVPRVRARDDGEQPPAGSRLPDAARRVRRTDLARRGPRRRQPAGGRRQAAGLPRGVRARPRADPDRVRRHGSEGRARGDRAARHRGGTRRAPRGRRADGARRMSAALRVVAVNGSPSEKSKTVGLVDVVLGTLEKALAPHGVAVEARRIDVYRLGPDFTGALERDRVAPAVEEVLRQAEQADLLVAATPVFRGSYTGLFKHFFDLVDQYALANKPVLLAATGGGEHHALVLEHALRPLFGFFQSLTVPVAVFASSGDFDGTTLLTPRVYGRVEMAVDDVAGLLADRVRQTA